MNMNVVLLSAWMLWSTYALGTRPEICFVHGCSGYGMLLERECDNGLGTDALVTELPRNTRRSGPCVRLEPLRTGTLLRSGHGCSGHLLLELEEKERQCSLGMEVHEP